MPHPALGHATLCLRRAETLAGLVGAVSGPADVAPAELTSAWLGDWVERAKQGLERAWEDAKREAETAKERAKKIAQNIESGASAIRGLPGKVVETARDALDKLIDVAQKIQRTITAATVVATVVVAALVARYMGWL